MTSQFPFRLLCALLMAIGVLVCNTPTPPATQPPPVANPPVAKPSPARPAPDAAAQHASKGTATVAPGFTARQSKLVGPLAAGRQLETELAHDFDGDGVADLALVLATKAGPESEGKRTLVMGLADGDGYRSVQSSSCIALCVQCGGVMGDPYNGMAIRGARSVRVTNAGGSRQRWSTHYTVAWRKDGFYVVGADLMVFDTLRPASETKVSINLLSGKYTRTGRDGAQKHPHGPMPISDCSAIETLTLSAFE